MTYKILMVDDDIKNLKATKGFLEANGFKVIVSQSGDEAMQMIKDEEFALVLLDYQMPEIMGDTLAAQIRKENPLQQVAMFSCDLSREAVKLSLRAGAVDFIEKSEDPAEILSRIQLYCNRYELLGRTIRPNKDKNENRKLIESVGMIGQSEPLANTATTVKMFAQAKDTTVLIRGESGAGKELVAKALHQLSPRSKGPFVAINCAAIPKDLLESELFGHKKGSFTGAHADQDGKFVLANGGTIFLDEIGELPMELQAKLLRVIQERVVESIGSRLPRKIDVRLITATHRNLEERVQKELFREDLLYRIKVVEIEVPALRNRLDDIEPLVAYFTEIYNQKNATKKYFQRRTLDVLRKYSWPGNVRELSHVVEKHLVQCQDNIVRPDDLDLKLYALSPTQTCITLSQFDSSQRQARQEFLKQVIELAGSKAEAARRLGITPTHIQYLLNESKSAREKAENEKVKAADIAFAAV